MQINMNVLFESYSIIIEFKQIISSNEEQVSSLTFNKYE